MLKKLLFTSLCFLMLIACVSASDLVSEDFDNFTVDVPSGADFVQAAPAGTQWTGDANGNFVPLNLNPYWADESNGISLEYADKEYKSMMNDRYNGSSLVSDDGNIHVFDISGCKYNNDYQYAVCVAGTHSTVIICGNDLDTLTEMARTVKFT